MPSEPELDPQTDEAQTVPARRRCRHIFTAGNQCGSPCLRKEQFCYYHHTTRRPVADPITRVGRDFVYNLPNPEDRASILAALAQVMQAVARQNVDPRTAGLLLYSLQIALCALPKEPSMSQPQSRTISAAASRTSTRNAVPAKRMPALPPVDEIFVDETHGLIAPEAWLVEEDDDEEEDAPPRRSLARQLLDEVEAYEARQAASAAEEAIKKAAYEEGRAAAFKELETRTHQTLEPRSRQRSRNGISRQTRANDHSGDPRLLSLRNPPSRRSSLTASTCVPHISPLRCGTQTGGHGCAVATEAEPIHCSSSQWSRETL